MTHPADTRWTLLRWRISIWMLWRALRIAPDGSAAVALEDHLHSWAATCRIEWHKRYPRPEIARNDEFGADVMTDLNEARAVAQSHENTVSYTPGPWHPGHLCDDASKCNCRYIFGGSYAGAIGEVYVDNGKVLISAGANDCPPPNEAKANLRLMASAPCFVVAVEQMLAHEQAGGDGWWKGWEMLKEAYRNGVAAP